MGLRKWFALLQCIILSDIGRCTSGLACRSGYFRSVKNVVPKRDDLAASTRVEGVLSPAWCTAMCLAQQNCLSVVYDLVTSVCYHNSGRLDMTFNVVKTSSSYAELICNDVNDCGVSSACSAAPLSGTVYTGCTDAKQQGNFVSGPYFVDPDGLGSFLVWCDFIGNEAWTVFQRRLNGNVDFYRGWADYKNGFGNMAGEYWLGLERLYRLTRTLQPKLYIYLDDFDGASTTANYSSMVLSNEAGAYQLTLGLYSGYAGDSMGTSSAETSTGMKFTTWDRDNDVNEDNCAVLYQGAWWYNSCHEANLNGLYLRGGHSTFANGVNWLKWRGYFYSLRTTIMRVAA